tara:strand:- start:451 stop:861 length:411 start_codon:yes stop_codon:yes gene_type:complete
MKKSDLKKLIKPLVKECINEVLIEEGMLSNIVSEVAQGLQTNLVVESKTIAEPRKEPAQKKQQQRTRIANHKRKLMESIGSDAYNGVNLFENTEPLNNRETSGGANGQADLGNPQDSGVDISSLMNGASKVWDAMK